MAKKKPTKAQRERWAKVAELGCYVGIHFPEVNSDMNNPACGGYVNIHHKTGEGRNHDKVIGLCTNHHIQWSPLGFGFSVHNGTKVFEEKYVTQQEMLDWVDANV